MIRLPQDPSMARYPAPTPRRHLVSFILGFGLLGLVQAAALEAQLTPEQVTQLQTVSAAVISPDGSQVAYTVSRPRAPEEDTLPGLRARSELWVVAASGGEPRPVIVAPASAGSPAWSPDGSQLAFLYQGQVHVVDANERGEPEPLTAHPAGVMSFRWSPDGSALAFAARVPEDPADLERRRRGDDVQVAEGAYLPWVYPLQAPRPVRLHVQDLLSGEVEVLTPAEWMVRDMVWAPDSHRLAVQVTEGRDADSEQMFRQIWMVSRGGASPEVFAPTAGKLGPMTFSPDGTQLAWLGAIALNDPIAQSLFVGEPGQAGRLLTPGWEATITALTWHEPDAIHVVAVESTRTAVHRVSAATGEASFVMGRGAEIFQMMTLAADGRTAAFPASTWQHPQEVFVGDLRAGSLARSTHHNPFLEGIRLGVQETVSYTARDGLRIDGILIHPLDRPAGEGRPPLAILPHGGPEGIDLDGWGTNALYPAQVLAGAGYAVFRPNYRASGGRGVDFSRGDHRDLGGREFDDVLDGIDYLHAQGLADGNRVGISGTSYGGFFSAWAGTRHADRFRLAIPFAGISNWMSFTGTTDIPWEMSLVHWDLLPWENPLLMWERSPLAWISESSTPMVIGHGLVDERVHPEQMIQLHQFLRLRGVPTELVLYPREPHGLLERQHQLDYMRRILEAFETYVRPE
jgi:dipeptidyl aminopeptidase/acylaminoacyl peptidase